jgi:hypothetical protein
MLRRLLIVAAVAALTVLVIKSMPDLRRYQKIRSM